MVAAVEVVCTERRLGSQGQGRGNWSAMLGRFVSFFGWLGLGVELQAYNGSDLILDYSGF